MPNFHYSTDKNHVLTNHLSFVEADKTESLSFVENKYE
jgi:hypothetical protein